ncbi:MAG: tetratricopeptide repeat protein [Bacteroidetes bacterium]|nr:tetratricopeptide repeat protein [Bacteroidota bacterium]
MKHLVIILTTLLFFAVTNSTYCQRQKIDSLQTAIRAATTDTGRVNMYAALADAFLTTYEADSCIYYANETEKKAKQINYLFGIGKARYLNGVANITKSKYPEAYIALMSAKNVFEKLDNPVYLSKCYRKIGDTYYWRHEIVLAAENYYKAISHAEKARDTLMMILSNEKIIDVFEVQEKNEKALERALKQQQLVYKWHSLKQKDRISEKIGLLYVKLKDYKKAIQWNEESLRLSGLQKDTNGIANSYSSIGTVYRQSGNSEKALDYYRRALAIYEKNGNRLNYGDIHYQIGTVFENINKPDSSIVYRLKAMQVFREINENRGIAYAYYGLSTAFEMLGKLQEAESYMYRYLLSADSLNDPGIRLQAYEKLADIREKRGNAAGALSYYHKFMVLKDSIARNDESSKIESLQAKMDFDKKIQINDQKQKEEDLKSQAQLSRERYLRNTFIWGFILMIIIAVLSFRSFLRKKKDNLVINRQKKLVDEKQREILDSIRYAKRIQQSLLPTEKYIERILNKKAADPGKQ